MSKCAYPKCVRGQSCTCRQEEVQLITSKQLNTVYSMAKNFHNDSAHKGLEPNEITAKYFILAVSQFLNLDKDFEFPDFRLAIVPDDEV